MLARQQHGVADLAAIHQIDINGGKGRFYKARPPDDYDRHIVLLGRLQQHGRCRFAHPRMSRYGVDHIALPCGVQHPHNDGGVHSRKLSMRFVEIIEALHAALGIQQRQQCCDTGMAAGAQKDVVGGLQRPQRPDGQVVEIAGT